MPTANPLPDPPLTPSHRTPAKTLGAIVLGGLSLVYLLNPTAGFLELIPDNIPVIGNLDEVAATVLLLNCLAYFGLDLTHLVSGMKRREKNVTPPDKMPR